MGYSGESFVEEIGLQLDVIRMGNIWVDARKKEMAFYVRSVTWMW